MKWYIAAVLVLLGGITLSGCASSPGTFTAKGTLVVHSCFSGTQNIDLGKQTVEIQDPTQVSLATAAVQDMGVSESADECDYSFKVDGVPTGKPYYRVVVQGISFGHFTQSQLTSGASGNYTSN